LQNLYAKEFLDDIWRVNSEKKIDLKALDEE
jgi:hypothetical protein